MTRHSIQLTASSAAVALLALSVTALATPAALAGPGADTGVQLSQYSGPEFDLGAVVALRRHQQAQYVVDNALELGLYR